MFKLPLISSASKVMLKIPKLGFSSMWTENFQMYKLGWEKAEEPDIKLPNYRYQTIHLLDYRERKGIKEKHLLLLPWLR